MGMQYCQQRFARITRALAISAALSAPAMALDLIWLTNPALQGRVTFDGFLGNADDVIIPGINTLGAASQFASTTGYGFVQGTHSASGLTIFGPQDRLVFGTNIFNSVDVSGEGNLYLPAAFQRARHPQRPLYRTPRSQFAAYLHAQSRSELYQFGGNGRFLERRPD